MLVRESRRTIYGAFPYARPASGLSRPRRTNATHFRRFNNDVKKLSHLHRLSIVQPAARVRSLVRMQCQIFNRPPTSSTRARRADSDRKTTCPAPALPSNHIHPPTHTYIHNKRRQPNSPPLAMAPPGSLFTAMYRHTDC